MYPIHPVLPVAGELRPLVAEGHRAVEDRRARLRIPEIRQEVAQPLELPPAPGLRGPERGLDPASLEDLEGLRIQVRLVIDALGDVVRDRAP